MCTYVYGFAIKIYLNIIDNCLDKIRLLLASTTVAS